MVHVLGTVVLDQRPVEFHVRGAVSQAQRRILGVVIVREGREPGAALHGTVEAGDGVVRAEADLRGLREVERDLRGVLGFRLHLAGDPVHEVVQVDLLIQVVDIDRVRVALLHLFEDEFHLIGPDSAAVDVFLTAQLLDGSQEDGLAGTAAVLPFVPLLGLHSIDAVGFRGILVLREHIAEHRDLRDEVQIVLTSLVVSQPVPGFLFLPPDAAGIIDELQPVEVRPEDVEAIPPYVFHGVNLFPLQKIIWGLRGAAREKGECIRILLRVVDFEVRIFGLEVVVDDLVGIDEERAF